MYRRLVSLLVIATLAGVASSEEQNWPQFRGPRALGIANGNNYAIEFGEDLNIAWKTKLPSGVSSPCIWKKHIFLTAYAPERNALETICLDRESGEVVWRKDAPTEKIEDVHEVSSPANATPATDGERVYVYFESFGLISYDFEGNTVWSKQLPLLQSPFGSGTSPIVTNGIVVLNRDTSRRGRNGVRAKIMAFDAATGETRWETNRPASRTKYSTPVIWDADGSAQVLAMGTNQIGSYSLESGEELWWVVDLPPQVCATPQVVGQNVYVTATGMFGEPESFKELPSFDDFLKEHDEDEDGFLGLDEIPNDFAVIDRRASGGAGNSPLKQFSRGIDRDRDGKIGKDEWNGFNERFGGFIKKTKPGVLALKLGGDGNVTKDSVVWQAERGVAEVPSLLILDERVFVVRNGGIVHCKSIKDGKDLYRGRLGATGGYYASPVAAGNKVYFASDRGVVTVIDGATNKLSVLARNDMKEPIMATPALVDGVIYCRTEGYLYAIQE